MHCCKTLRSRLPFRLSAFLMLCVAPVPFAQVKTTAPAPDLEETLKFIQAGLEHDFRYTADGKWYVSSSEMISSGGEFKKGLVVVTVTTTSKDCVVTSFSDVNLKELDPGDVQGKDQPWGIYMAVGTTNGKKLVKRGSFAEKRGPIDCETFRPQPENTFSLRFDNPAYRDRAIKAMRHAIELAGGKPSDF